MRMPQLYFSGCGGAGLGDRWQNQRRMGHTIRVNDGRLMLLDTAALYFRAFHGVPDTVRSPDGTSVNAVRGLLDIIARLVTDYTPTRLIACWDDDWRPSGGSTSFQLQGAPRRRVVDGRLRRRAGPELLTPQVPIIVETLAALGFPIVGRPDLRGRRYVGTLAATGTRSRSSRHRRPGSIPGGR